MSKKMKTRAELGKPSRYLQNLKSRNRGASSTRRSVREAEGRRKSVPNSTKLGKGTVVQGSNIIRNLPRNIGRILKKLMESGTDN